MSSEESDSAMAQATHALLGMTVDVKERLAGKKTEEQARTLFQEWASLNKERSEYHVALAKLKGVNTELNRQLLSLSRSVNDALTVKLEEVEKPEQRKENEFLALSPRSQEERLKKLNEKLNSRSNLLDQLKKQIVSQQNTNISLEKKLGVSSNAWVMKELRERLAKRKEELETTRKEKRVIEGTIVFADKELLSLQKKADEGPNGWQRYEGELNTLREQLRTVYHKRQADTKTLNDQYGEMERNDAIFNAFIKFASERRAENPGPYENLGDDPSALDVIDAYSQMKKDERKLQNAIKKTEDAVTEKRNGIKKMEDRLRSSARVLARDCAKLEAKFAADKEKSDALMAKVEKVKASQSGDTVANLTKLAAAVEAKNNETMAAFEAFKAEALDVAAKHLPDEFPLADSPGGLDASMEESGEQAPQDQAPQE